MLLGLLAFGLSSQAIAQKGSAGLPASPETDPEAFLGQLGGDLKMAVRVQAMSSEDARTLWEAAAKLVNQGAEDKGGNDGEGKRDGGGHLWFAMRVPQGGDFRTLLRPEFIRRDIDLIVDRLALDETTAPIAESVLLDYEDAFETETSRFRDLLELGSNQVELANFEPGYRAIDPSNWNAVEVGIVDGLTERGVSDEKSSSSSRPASAPPIATSRNTNGWPREPSVSRTVSSATTAPGSDHTRKKSTV